jgi:hypothetical protein
MNAWTRLVLPGIAFTGAVVACQVVPATADAAPAQSSHAAATVSSTTVLTGHLLRNGQGVAGDIIATVWPKKSELADEPLGSRVDTQIVYRGSAADDGSFTVSLNPEDLPAKYVTKDGQVDLEVTAADASSQTDFFTSIIRAEMVPAVTGLAARTGWTTQTSVQRGSTRAQDIKLDLATQLVDTTADPKSEQVHLTASERGSISAQDTSGSAVPKLHVEARNERLMDQPLASFVSGGVTAADVAEPTDVCSTYSVGDVKNRKEAFARVWAWSGALATVDFNAGSTHTLGVAMGSADQWSASGTETIETSAGASVGRVADAVAVNKVNYRDYKNICWAKTHRIPVGFFAVLPSGEFTYSPHQTYPRANCASLAASGTFWKVKGKNVTYSGGVDLPYVNVSAQSGWNQETKVAWQPTANTWLCGSTDNGWASSPQAEAHKR